MLPVSGFKPNRGTGRAKFGHHIRGIAVWNCTDGLPDGWRRPKGRSHCLSRI